MREELTWHHRVNRVLNERLRPWWGTPRRVLLAVLVAFFFLVTTLCHYHEFQGKGTPPTLRVRNACNPCAGAAVPDYCALPQEYQFEKVIWFITDGYPLYMQREWLPLYADHAIPFVVEVPGRKWSHTVYTSWFTGMPNVNVLARPIYGDSLFESMRRASGHRCSLSPEKDLQTNNSTLPAFNLHWVGPTWCPVDLIGGAEYVKSNLNFVEIDPVVEELEMVPNPYPALPLDSLPAYLEEIAKKGQSLLTHTGLIDKAAHYGMEFDEPQEHLFELFANSGLREFIDAHPDYLLVLSSDHGLSMPGKFHGDGALKSSANIGMFTFYNPRFVGQNLTTMDVVDVLPTLTKYLKNVDIPFYSVGEVRNTYGPNNEQYEVNVLKQNLAQLRDLMAAEGKEVDDAAIDRAMSSNDTVALRDNVRAIKSVLFQAVTRPYYQYTIYTLVILAVGCVVYWTRVVNADAIHHTLLLALPLVFSFGFFLKPLDFYLFESNLTFYFGVGTSAFVACLLGGWSGTGYILLNELINLGGYFLRFTLDNTSLPVVSLVGIALSFIESRLYLSQQRTLATSSRNHLLALLLFLNVCNVMYVCTSFADAAYAGGINIFAFAIYASLPAVCVWLFVRALWSRACAASSAYTALAAPKMTPSVDALSISLTSFLLLLSGGSPLVFLFNLQSRQILPCLFGKPHVGGEKSEKAASTTSSAASHFAMQASAVYVLQGAMWVTWLVWGQTPDMEFDPKGGVAGIRSWNEYPTLAGALLVMQKAGVFPLAALHVGAMVVPNFFPLFILFLTTIINFLSVHMCFKRFSFKTPIESLLVITLLTWIQFLIMVLVKFNAQPEFADRNPWGFTIMKNFERKIVNPISAKVSERWRRKRV